MVAIKPSIQFHLPNPSLTTELGYWLAPFLVAGDILLLTGSIGAGKTHLARAIIQARMGEDVDVPSPSFSLIQTYEAPNTEIWHADLYRLGHPDEVLELGLEQAFATAICLIEWPERMGNLLPPQAIAISLLQVEDAREVVVCAPNHPHLIAALQSEWCDGHE